MSTATTTRAPAITTEKRLRGDGPTIANLKSAMTQHCRLVNNISKDETEVGLSHQGKRSCFKCGEKCHIAKNVPKKMKNYVESGSIFKKKNQSLWLN